LEYDKRKMEIDKYQTRQELKQQQLSILERKYYFERLQQTFDSAYKQRLKQIAIYMKPIFELDLLLKQDTTDVDGDEPLPITTASSPLTAAGIHKRTNSESSTASDEMQVQTQTTPTANRKKRKSEKTIMEQLDANDDLVVPLFNNDFDLYGGINLINPLNDT